MVNKTIGKKRTVKTTGNSFIEIRSAKIPNTGGISKIPKLQTAICVPRIDGDKSLPKYIGVKYARLGKDGPLPKPTKNNPTPFTIGGRGRNNSNMATATQL